MNDYDDYDNLTRLEDRVGELEGVIVGFLDYFQTSSGAQNQTFEGGKSISNVEVSDDLEEFLGSVERILEFSDGEEDVDEGVF